MKTFLYYLALVLGAPFALIFLHIKVSYEGGEKFSLPKGAIFISGHKSFLDAIAIAYLLFYQRLYFIAADWYHGFLIVFKPFMSLLGAVFVSPTGEGLNFLAKCKILLAKRKSLLIFPEGDYAQNKHLFELGEFKTGYLWVASESGAPIVPIISDFSYKLFSSLHFIIGKPIYLDLSRREDSFANHLQQVNKKIRQKCLSLFYLLKRDNSKRIKMHYTYKKIEKGDVIRVWAGIYHHYGIYFDDNHVLEFGHARQDKNEIKDVHFTSLTSFAGNQIPEVRIVSKRKQRTISDLTAYAEEVLGQKGYSLKENNCLDFANRLTLVI